jgi:hypothetical protein
VDRPAAPGFEFLRSDEQGPEKLKCEASCPNEITTPGMKVRIRPLIDAPYVVQVHGRIYLPLELIEQVERIDLESLERSLGDLLDVLRPAIQANPLRPAVGIEFESEFGGYHHLPAARSESFKDRRIAKIVKACQDLPGQELFQYLDENGERKDVTSADVNAYLREITGRDVTAKDFRTWAGTVLAALALQEFENFDTQAKVKKNVRAAIERVAARLGNTPTICRKCYVHPEILSLYAEGALLLQVKDRVEGELREDLATLKPEESAVLSLLEGRLNRDLKTALQESVNEVDKRTEMPSRSVTKNGADPRRLASGQNAHLRRRLRQQQVPPDAR